MWDLLDDALGEGTKLCLLVRDGVVEGNDAFFYNGDEYYEEFVGTFSRADGVSKDRGCNHKKLASFRHKTQKFFFWRIHSQNFFGQKTQMALGWLADQPRRFFKIQRAPL